MALHDIIDKITSDAEREVKNILDAAEAEIKTIEKEAKKKLETIAAEAEITRTRRASKVLERIMTKARHEAKMRRDENLRSLVDGVFEKVEEKLSQIPDDKYHNFLEKSLKDLPNEKGVFYIAPEKEKETLEVIKKSSHKDSEIKIENEGTLKGGFVFSTRDREFDYSFTSLLRALCKEKEVEISNKITTSLHGQ
ncbi:MAG: V-type ATP synthase subunit E [Anaplasmataceae bacterium]|nr:V-type ATP synthase subunit E [Anaplasmataceae bacterium]